MLRNDTKSELKPDQFQLLKALREVSDSIHTHVSWRRRRGISLRMHEILVDAKIGADSEFARKFAEALTGVEPDPWLTISEAQDALNELGVPVIERKLYRLKNRAKITCDGELIVAMDSKGNWGSPESFGMRDPRAIVKIRVRGSVHFQVEPSERSVNKKSKKSDKSAEKSK